MVSVSGEAHVGGTPPGAPLPPVWDPCSLLSPLGTHRPPATQGSWGSPSPHPPALWPVHTTRGVARGVARPGSLRPQGSQLGSPPGKPQPPAEPAGSLSRDHWAPGRTVLGPPRPPDLQAHRAPSTPTPESQGGPGVALVSGRQAERKPREHTVPAAHRPGRGGPRADRWPGHPGGSGGAGLWQLQRVGEGLADTPGGVSGSSEGQETEAWRGTSSEREVCGVSDFRLGVCWKPCPGMASGTPPEKGTDAAGSQVEGVKKVKATPGCGSRPRSWEGPWRSLLGQPGPELMVRDWEQGRAAEVCPEGLEGAPTARRTFPVYRHVHLASRPHQGLGRGLGREPSALSGGSQRPVGPGARLEGPGPTGRKDRSTGGCSRAASTCSLSLQQPLPPQVMPTWQRRPPQGAAWAGRHLPCGSRAGSEAGGPRDTGAAAPPPPGSRAERACTAFPLGWAGVSAASSAPPRDTTGMLSGRAGAWWGSGLCRAGLPSPSRAH